MTRSYWLTLFTVETWNEFLAHGGDVAGFSERRWLAVQRIRPGDYLLCYLIRVSRFVGWLEAVGEPFFDRQEIWRSRTYPSRVPVKTILALDAERGIPVLNMREELSVFRNLVKPEYWSGRFQVSPGRWNSDDGKAVIKALRAKEDQSDEC
jgi:hypothetical protein